MKLEELKNRLKQENIYENAYSFFGDGIGNCLVLTKEGYNWLIYYAERGEKTGVKAFEEEEDACLYFLNEILSDPVARRKAFTPLDFEQFPIWTGNDREGYNPVLEVEPSPKDYKEPLFIKANFNTNGYSFDGYLIGGKKFESCGLFIKGHRFRISLNQPISNTDNFLEIYELLNCKPFKFFPLHYQSSVRFHGGLMISGNMGKDHE